VSDHIKSFLASIDTHALATDAAAWGVRLLVALLIFVTGWWLARYLAGASRRVMIRGGADPLLGDFLRNIVFVFLLAIVVVGALDRVGVPTASLLAALGAAGIAVGLALQNSLSNLAAGVLLMINRPFRVGDYIQAAGVGGTVKSVNLLSTTLHSPDNCQIVVPNGKISSDSIINYSALDSRRLDLVVGIAYGDDIGAAFAAVNAVLAADERVLPDPAPVVALLELGDSSVNLAIRPWVASSDYWPARFGLQRAIKERFDAEGITIPFPQREITLHPAPASQESE
jgi:small conductance mechanosensitive channel